MRRPRLAVVLLLLLLSSAAVLCFHVHPSNKYHVSLIEGCSASSTFVWYNPLTWWSTPSASTSKLPAEITGSVTLDVPFDIKSKDGTVYVKGTLHRTANNCLQFKGDASLGPTGSNFDQTLRAGQNTFIPTSIAFSGVIILFYVQFDQDH